MKHWPTTCEVCGGPGMSLSPSWAGQEHSDPRDCRAVLERERRKMEREWVDALVPPGEEKG